MGIPDEDRIPYRHRYGDYTHLSRDGKYRFEWTPFTPAVEAWENAERLMKSALGHLAAVQKLSGFALNGLEGEHRRMMESVKVLGEDLQLGQEEAGKVANALRVANTDYAAAAEASSDEYLALMKIIDGTTTKRAGEQAGRDTTEATSEGQRDKDIFPFAGPKPK